MAEETDVENGRNLNSEGLVTLTVTSDRVIRHTFVHHSSTSVYIPNFIKIGKNFRGRTDVWTDGQDVRTFDTDIINNVGFVGKLKKSVSFSQQPFSAVTVFCYFPWYVNSYIHRLHSIVLLYTQRDRSRSERLSQSAECRPVDIAESATPISHVTMLVILYRYLYAPT